MKFGWLALMFPLAAWANFSTSPSIEFTMVKAGPIKRDLHYAVHIDENHPANDWIQVTDARGISDRIYEGPIDRMLLPKNIKDKSFGAANARLAKDRFLIEGTYDTSKDYYSGLRFLSGGKTVVHSSAGLVKFELGPGSLDEYVELDCQINHTGHEFLLVSVKSAFEAASGVYLFVGNSVRGMVTGIKLGDEYLTDGVIADLEENGDLKIPALNFHANVGKMLDERQKASERQRVAEKAFAAEHGISKDEMAWQDLKLKQARGKGWAIEAKNYAVSDEELLTETIALLSRRDEMMDLPGAPERVKFALRGMILRHFPTLPKQLPEIDEAARALAELWLRGRLNAPELHAIIANRLEVLPSGGNLKTCELALMNVKGEGGHASFYYRSVARKNLTALRRALRLQNRR